MQTFLYCIVMDGQFPHKENPQGVGDGWKGSQWSWMAQWLGKRVRLESRIFFLKSIALLDLEEIMLILFTYNT